MTSKQDGCLANERLEFVSVTQNADPKDLNDDEPAIVAHVRSRLKVIAADIETEKMRLKACEMHVKETAASNARIESLQSEAAKHERYLRVILRAARLIDKQSN